MVLGTIFVSMKPCGAGSLKSKRAGKEIYMIYRAEIKAVAKFQYHFSYFLVNLLRKASYLQELFLRPLRRILQSMATIIWIHDM